MSARDELDLAEVFAKIVQPNVSALFRPGELDSIILAWRTVRVPDVQPRPDVGAYSSFLLVTSDAAALQWTERVRLVLDLAVRDEGSRFELSGADDNADVDFEWLDAELYSRLQDFIAESAFGWGELRS